MYVITFLFFWLALPPMLQKKRLVALYPESWPYRVNYGFGFISGVILGLIVYALEHRMS